MQTLQTANFITIKQDREVLYYYKDLLHKSAIAFSQIILLLKGQSSS